jgi:hypothetical protein
LYIFAGHLKTISPKTIDVKSTTGFNIIVIIGVYNPDSPAFVFNGNYAELSEKKVLPIYPYKSTATTEKLHPINLWADVFAATYLSH